MQRPALTLLRRVRSMCHLGQLLLPLDAIEIMLSQPSDWRLQRRMFYFLSNSVKGDRSIAQILKTGVVDFICALKSLKRRRATSGDSYERNNYDRKQYDAILKSLILSLILLPISAMYFFWIYIPLLIYSTLFAYLLVFFQIASKKNKQAKHILIHITGSLKIGEH